MIKKMTDKILFKKATITTGKGGPGVRPLLLRPGSSHDSRQAARLGHLPSAASTCLELQVLNGASGQVRPRAAQVGSMTNAARKDENWGPRWEVLAAKRREGFSELLHWDHY